MWKHNNFINLQSRVAPPMLPGIEISLNGVIITLDVTTDRNWGNSQKYNSSKYTISNEKVVWSDGSIVQYNGVDVTSADYIIGGSGSPGIYTTRASTPQPTLTFKHFYDAGTIGSGTVKFRHYSQQEPSSGKVIKAGTYQFIEYLTFPANIDITEKK